jgi:hypothetical protein
MEDLVTCPQYIELPSEPSLGDLVEVSVRLFVYFSYARCSSIPSVRKQLRQEYSARVL